MSSRLFLLAAVVFARLAFASTPHAGPELPLSPLDDVPAQDSQYYPAVASRGEEAFAAWNDLRAGHPGTLIGSRIGADGTLLDRQGVLLDVYAGERPQVAWNGSEYLVLSTEDVPLAPYPTWAHRVSPDGKLLERFLLGTFYDVKLYGNGKEAVITASVFGEHFFARLGSDGRIRDKVTLKSSVASVAAPDGDDWILLLSRQACDTALSCVNGVFQFRVRDGKIVSEREVAVPLLQLPVRMTAATDGNGRVLLFWNEVSSRVVDNLLQQTEVSGVLRYIVVDRDAKVITLAHVVDRIQARFFTRDPTFQYIGPSIDRPGATWYGDRFVLTWAWLDDSGRSEVRTISVKPDGDPIERDPVTVGGITERFVAPYTRPVVAATFSRLHFLWTNTDARWTTWLSTRSVASLGELSAPFEARQRILRSASQQGAVETAVSADATFVIWNEVGVGDPHIRARIVGHDGSQSPVLEISQSGMATKLPAVAFAAGIWLAAWSENEYRIDSTGERDHVAEHILVRRYDRNGTSLDAAPVPIAVEYAPIQGGWFGPDKLSVAAGASQFAVAWSGPGGNAIRVVRVRTDAAPLDAEPVYLFTESRVQRGAPHLVWTGSDYFALWQEEFLRSPQPPFHAALAARVSTGGEITARFPELATTASGWDIRPSAFEVASNGTEILLTWSERRYNVRGCVYAQRFGFDGAPRGPREELVCGTGFATLPARTFAVWDGAQFRVLYSFEDALWAHTIGGGERQKVFETTGGLALARPVVTPIGIVVPYTRSDSAFGSLPRVFRRTISFEPPRRRSVR